MQKVADNNFGADNKPYAYATCVVSALPHPYFLRHSLDAKGFPFVLSDFTRKTS